MLSGEALPGAFSRFYGDSASPSDGGGPVLLPPAHPPLEDGPGALLLDVIAHRPACRSRCKWV